MPRYIDADKLLARYKERCAGCKETKNYCEHCCDLADVIDDIEDAPTADVVERNKGKWEEKTVLYDDLTIEQWQSARCSVCGLYHTTPYSYYFYHYKYCPYCGAEMSQGEENEGN